MTGAEGRPTFSLVFLTWNAGEAIVESVDSLKRGSFDDYEVVVVDNGSEDDTLDRVRAAYSDDESVRVFENGRNLGFSRGINRGVRESEGEYVCCYNHDTQFAPDYLETLADRVTPDAVWTTARRNHRVDPDRSCVRLLSRYRFTLPYVVDSLSGTAAVNYVPGDGVIIPRDVYEGPLGSAVFDPSLPIRGEDVDLSLRLVDLGVPMRAVLDTYSIHPDKGEMYTPTVENLRTLLRTVRARVAAHRNNDVPASAVAVAAASLVTTPLVLYGTPYPRSERALLEATTVEGPDSEPNRPQSDRRTPESRG
jgi:GT2 family glycosyltransferase